jgi:thiamine biosynthesis lipoprotein
MVDSVEDALSPRISPRTGVFHRSFHAMNTRFSMVLVGMDDETAETLAAVAERDLRASERLMSRFDPASPVSDLNRCASENAVAPPEQLWEILLLCRQYWERTEGAFDITLWPLNRLWREHRDLGEEPSVQTIEQVRQQSGFNCIRFDSAARTVQFQAAGMSLDFGGFGKGFALEKLARSLRAQGVERAFLSFGESSITVLGSHPHGPVWPVGIANMFRPSETVYTFQLKDASLSSSGTAPFNRMAGTRAHESILGQIIDPRSGHPTSGYRTMSVASASGIEAEVLSTALLVTPEHERSAVLSRFSGISAVEIVYRSGVEEFVPHIQWHYGI